MKITCPDEELLADFMDGRLSGKKQKEVESHLSSCEACVQTYAIGRKLVRGGGEPFHLGSVPETVTEAAVRCVKELGRPKESPVSWPSFARMVKDLYPRVLHFFTSSLPPECSPAPIRGSRQVLAKDLVRLRRTFKQIDSEILIEKTSGNCANIHVHVTCGRNGQEDVRVHLECADREVSSDLLKQGSVLFDHVPFGGYRLLFIRGKERLGVVQFEIRGAENAGKKPK